MSLLSLLSVPLEYSSLAADFRAISAIPPFISSIILSLLDSVVVSVVIVVAAATALGLITICETAGGRCDTSPAFVGSIKMVLDFFIHF